MLNTLKNYKFSKNNVTFYRFEYKQNLKASQQLIT